ncbi:MAG: hypothetical protein QM704_15480 [Anaeromyxobacteraceae bacterium]
MKSRLAYGAGLVLAGLLLAAGAGVLYVKNDPTEPEAAAQALRAAGDSMKGLLEGKGFEQRDLEAERARNRRIAVGLGFVGLFTAGLGVARAARR